MKSYNILRTITPKDNGGIAREGVIKTVVGYKSAIEYLNGLAERSKSRFGNVSRPNARTINIDRIADVMQFSIV